MKVQSDITSTADTVRLAEPSGSQKQLQDGIDRENLSLQRELLSMSKQVNTVETTLREVATLNQMFSTEVMHQSEQIETLYLQVGVFCWVSVGTLHKHTRELEPQP